MCLRASADGENVAPYPPPYSRIVSAPAQHPPRRHCAVNEPHTRLPALCCVLLPEHYARLHIAACCCACVLSVSHAFAARTARNAERVLHSNDNRRQLHRCPLCCCVALSCVRCQRAALQINIPSRFIALCVDDTVFPDSKTPPSGHRDAKSV